jgi:signal transduction histidine kinase
MESFTVALKSRFLEQNVGILTLTLDLQLLGEDILFRAINILTFEMARNIILALASLFVFNWFIGTPLIRLSRNFAVLSDTSGIPKPLEIPPNHADDEFGDLIGNINRTLSERAEFESQLRGAQKMEAIGQLAGGIAHDFNNLLAIIKGNLELLQGFHFDDQAALKHVDIANRAIDRGADLTRKLLSFARRGQTSVEDLSVNDIVRDVMQLLPRALTAAYDVRENLADDLWPVTVNRGDMQDSVINLALNAFDAMPRGGVLLFETSNRVLDEEYVRLNPQARTGEFVLLSVTDTGTGIPKDLQNRIFEPFFTTKSGSGGTGLGLTMVYGFVQRSGGLMTINSEEDRGVTFNVYLPRATGASSGMMPISGVEELPRGSETVLVVDDETDIVDLACAHLRELGYRVLSASSGEEAVEVLGTNPDIDLLFTDIVMPGTYDGFDLAAKCFSERPGIAVLLASGYMKNRDWSVDISHQYRQELLEDQLVKPYTKAELATAVRKVLERSRAKSVV